MKYEWVKKEDIVDFVGCFYKVGIRFGGFEVELMFMFLFEFRMIMGLY